MRLLTRARQPHDSRIEKLNLLISSPDDMAGRKWLNSENAEFNVER